MNEIECRNLVGEVLIFRPLSDGGIEIVARGDDGDRVWTFTADVWKKLAVMA